MTAMEKNVAWTKNVSLKKIARKIIATKIMIVPMKNAA